MANFKVLMSVGLFAVAVKMQEMPDYGDNVENEDYPNYPDHLSRPDPYDGMGPGGPYGDAGAPDYGGRGIARKNEIVVGRKRFKLYEKKRLNHKKAKDFCKSKDGKLAEAHSLEEMKRLEGLFTKAKMMGMDVWVGADKKKWKQHSMKEVTHPGLNLDKAGMEKAGIKASLVGGGMKEMCPAISLSTRNLAPVQCVMPLPFICEYDRNRPRTTRKPKGNSTTKKTKKRNFRGSPFGPGVGAGAGPRKDEMKK